jgi:FkbM family methyltransferase
MQVFGADQSEHEAMFHDHVYKFRNAHIPQHESGWYFHSEEVVKHRHWLIERDQVVIDVGACFGSWTIPALLQGAIVYAYEPHPLLFTELCHNVSINGLSGRFVPQNKAVWSEGGKILELPQYDLSMMRHQGDNQPVLRVMTVTLDEALIDLLERLDWIKIDVEGAEIEVLKGARQLIEKFNPRIIVEWHADRNGDPEMKYLEGWQVKQIDPGHYLVQHY